jgi:hypothetical protein
VWMDGKPPVSRRRYAWRRFVGHHLPMLLICLTVATLIAVVLAPFMLVSVPIGDVGVSCGSDSAAALCSIHVS